MVLDTNHLGHRVVGRAWPADASDNALRVAP